MTPHPGSDSSINIDLFDLYSRIEIQFEYCCSRLKSQRWSWKNRLSHSKQSPKIKCEDSSRLHVIPLPHTSLVTHRRGLSLIMPQNRRVLQRLTRAPHHLHRQRASTGNTYQSWSWSLGHWHSKLIVHASATRHVHEQMHVQHDTTQQFLESV